MGPKAGEFGNIGGVYRVGEGLSRVTSVSTYKRRIIQPTALSLLHLRVQTLQNANRSFIHSFPVIQILFKEILTKMEILMGLSK